MNKPLSAILLALAISLGAQAEEIYSEFPDTINPNERYIFYSHGLIVEGDDPRPESPEFGIYQFPEITQAIFESGVFNLIAHHRPANTDMRAYVDQLVAWVEELIEVGVESSKITLIGFSRGAQLTVLASSRLKGFGINTVIMGLCFDGDFVVEPPLSLDGHVLSIYETSDVVTSCSRLLDRSVNAKSTKEMAISTGEKHGAFFKPRSEWILPLKEWLIDIGY